MLYLSFLLGTATLDLRLVLYFHRTTGKHRAQARSLNEPHGGDWLTSPECAVGVHEDVVVVGETEDGVPQPLTERLKVCPVVFACETEAHDKVGELDEVGVHLDRTPGYPSHGKVPVP